MIDVIIMLAHIATAAGVLLVWQQVKVAREGTELSRKAMADDHERSRRQFAIEVTREWNRAVSPETSAARELIEKLGSEECRSIAKLEPVQIAAKYKYLVDICLGTNADREPKGEGAEKELISLDDADVKQLRYLGVDYLNETEIPLSAWHQKVGDEKYLEREFESISNVIAMASFREALGETHRYPALEEFLKWKEQRQENPRPSRIGTDSPDGGI